MFKMVDIQWRRERIEREEESGYHISTIKHCIVATIYFIMCLTMATIWGRPLIKDGIHSTKHELVKSFVKIKTWEEPVMSGWCIRIMMLWQGGWIELQASCKPLFCYKWCIHGLLTSSQVATLCALGNSKLHSNSSLIFMLTVKQLWLFLYAVVHLLLKPIAVAIKQGEALGFA